MFVNINSLFPKLVKRVGLSGKIGEEAVKTAFKDVIEEMFKNREISKVQPVFFKNGVLTAASLSSDFSKILNEKEREIISEINKKIGRDAIQKINYLT